MTATVIWRPEPMTARLVAAGRSAAGDYAKAASAKAATASKRVAASIRVAGAGSTFTVGSNHPLGILVHEGAGAHEIAPRGNVLRLADGRFVTGPVRHPGMRATPFLTPFLPLWPTMYRRAASGALRGGVGGLF